MNFTDIKTKSQGFTIVELLIVVVVIAILAAITIVSYNGITTKANQSASKSTAATWQKKIELYQADKSQYPFAFSSISTDTNSGEAWYISSSTPLTSSTPTSSNGKTTVQVQPCSGTSTAPTNDATTTGIRITYYTFDTPTTAQINIGNVNTCASGWTNP